jgi:hypothetical protein
LSYRDLQIQFYEGYDENFLSIKTLALNFAIRERGKFSQFIDNYEVTSFQMTDAEFLDALHAELFFTFVHQFESFFALLCAHYQEEPHWVYMTRYRIEDVKKLVNLFLNDDIKTLTNGAAKTRSEFVQTALYQGYRGDAGISDSQWEINLSNVAWIIERMARQYLYGRVAYNSYKHGLRVTTGTALRPRYLEDSSEIRIGLGVEIISEDTLTYLELEEDSHGNDVLQLVTKFFSPEECTFYSSAMLKMIETMKYIRLSLLGGRTEYAHPFTFLDLDRNLVEAMCKHHETIPESREWRKPL